VQLYLVSRARAWLSEEELAATSECAPAVLELFAGDIRWIRSYIVQEDDGTYGACCLFEASSREVLERYADALMLPADAIKPVVTTSVSTPDPEPVGSA